ncbi:hypothetical protein KFE25_006286 [Diacronema lutheri]|uniref:BTB domain-containing protein n=3 Tax=Diacronema lutheri TaxID=2081491 RepID=A0A8J5XVM0_DIALT|nr:hypothetical protein KFE25_006286 [Diacronema lutheri]
MHQESGSDDDDALIAPPDWEGHAAAAVPEPPALLAITYHGGRDVIILDPDLHLIESSSAAAVCERAPPPPPGSCLDGLLRDAANYFADTFLVPACGAAPIAAHRAILVRDAALASRLAFAPDSGGGSWRLAMDEDAPSVLARVRALYGCAPPDARAALDGSDADADAAWAGSAAVRTHLLQLAADAAGAQGAQSDSGLANADARVRTAHGACHHVHRCVLAFRSGWFLAAFAHAERNGRASDVLIDFEDAVPGVMRPLLDYLYTGHLDDASPLLTPELIVPAARLADQLLLEPLRSRALELMRSAVDNANAASLYQVGAALHDDGLAGKCVEHMVHHEAATREPSLFADLPADVQSTVLALRRASRTNPLSRNALLSSPRELLAILRESLDEQVTRHEHAVQRQRDADDEAGAPLPPQWQWLSPREDAAERKQTRIGVGGAQVRHALRARAAQIEALRAYIRAQEAVFLQ